MMNVDKARELVAEFDKKVYLHKVEQANKLVHRVEVNVIDSATRGKKKVDISINEYHDATIIQLATAEIEKAGYTVEVRQHYLTIGW